MDKGENFYKMIAGNIRKERKQLGMSQSQLAERADLSIDTIKSVENGRRAMSLDTYLKIVQALETTPYALMNRKHPEEYIDRFAFMMTSRNEREIELALHMVEQLLKGQDSYMRG
jgi:transcriptional regulator with XRE-family HTH domain